MQRLAKPSGVTAPKVRILLLPPNTEEDNSMASVWDLIEDDPEVAKDLKERSDLIIVLVGTIRDNKWSYSKSADVLGIDVFSVKALLDGRIERFRTSDLAEVVERVKNQGHDMWEFPLL